MTNYLLFILLVNGLLWLRSSLGKVTGGKFVEELGGSLGKFASKNPYPGVKEFLEGVAIPNSAAFGVLTMYGELLSALAIVGGALMLFIQPKNGLARLALILGLIGGAFLNTVFWLSAGWTSPSTDGMNLLMLVVEVVGILALLKPVKV